ncbi:MAG: 16S rRNA (guanine(966)-N(2))-methyltransferase RsmD [Planctomycetes bacterium]|nr:16S rRNA (guanine(966)-N(2))-methyltransferase RsmD [Planctomycetota bacterium]
MRRPDPDRSPRILAGRFRGRALFVPEGLVTRPVRALVRRSLFDSLQDAVVGARWLDLFAGSGSFGIEALSRGAVHATFVEAGREGVRCLRENLARLDLAPPAVELLTGLLPALLHQPPPPGAPFDFVTLDPPFALVRASDSRAALLGGLSAAGEAGWLRPGALLCFEEPADCPADMPAGYVEESRREHGKTSRMRRLRWHA